MEKIKEFLKKEKWFIIIFGVIFLGLFAFQYLGHINTPKDGDTLKKTRSIGTKSTQITHTDIRYVPKQLELNKDGQWVKEDTDVELTQAKPQVTVKVNGQKHKFDLQTNEKQKFEDGKLQVDQTNTISFDVTVPDRHELTVYGYAKANTSGDQPMSGIGIEKKNGKFHYGAEKDLTGSDKDTRAFVRYDLVKLYTN